MSLSIGQIIAISITATAASIGAAGIPQVNKRIWNGSGWKIMFPYFFSRLASWRWWWCSRRWDFLLRTWPSSWPSTGSSTGYRWWGWRQLVTDVQFFCIFVLRSHFSMLLHSCVVIGELKISKRLNLFTGSEQQSTCLATPLGLASSTTSARTNLTISENRPPSQSCPIWHYICQMTRPAWRKYLIKLAPGTLMAALSLCQWPMLRRTGTRENETTEWEFWWGFLY